MARTTEGSTSFFFLSLKKVIKLKVFDDDPFNQKDFFAFIFLQMCKNYKKERSTKYLLLLLLHAPELPKFAQKDLFCSAASQFLKKQKQKQLENIYMCVIK